MRIPVNELINITGIDLYRIMSKTWRVRMGVILACERAGKDDDGMNHTRFGVHTNPLWDGVHVFIRIYLRIVFKRSSDKIPLLVGSGVYWSE
jgi:hypothetical protein